MQVRAVGEPGSREIGSHAVAGGALCPIIKGERGSGRLKGTLSPPLRVETTQLGRENVYTQVYTCTGNYLVSKAANVKMPIYGAEKTGSALRV